MGSTFDRAFGQPIGEFTHILLSLVMQRPKGLAHL
jgi:hypothetical protein